MRYQIGDMFTYRGNLVKVVASANGNSGNSMQPGVKPWDYIVKTEKKELFYILEKELDDYLNGE